MQPVYEWAVRTWRGERKVKKWTEGVLVVGGIVGVSITCHCVGEMDEERAKEQNTKMKMNDTVDAV